VQECGYTQTQLAERVGKSRPAVANTLRLLNLPTSGQQALLAGVISAGHARALLALPDTELMQSALNELISHDLSVRQTEALVKKWVEMPPAAPEPPPAPEAEALATHFAHLVDRFRSALGTKVSLARNRDGSGKLVIHFFSDDDLGSLYERITGATE
jgi:ParB family chromosome partitioning protein